MISSSSLLSITTSFSYMYLGVSQFSQKHDVWSNNSFQRGHNICDMLDSKNMTQTFHTADLFTILTKKNNGKINRPLKADFHSRPTSTQENKHGIGPNRNKIEPAHGLSVPIFCSSLNLWSPTRMIKSWSIFTFFGPVVRKVETGL